MYINSVKVKTNELVIAGCNLLLICNDSKSEMNKTITFPNGYQLQDKNIIFKVNFKNGCATDTEPSNTIKLNDKKIFANQYGSLVPLSYHLLSSEYITLQENTVLELYYDSTLDSSNGGFVIVGNPIVISTSDYIIFADGTVNKQPISSVVQDSTDPITSGGVYSALANIDGFTIKRLKDADTSATGTTYSLDTGESFLDWDFIIPVVTLYDREQAVLQFIPKAEIESNMDGGDSEFLHCGSTGGTDRRLAWSPKSATTYRVGLRNGTSGHLPHLYGFYGVKFN